MKQIIVSLPWIALNAFFLRKLAIALYALTKQSKIDEYERKFYEIDGHRLELECAINAAGGFKNLFKMYIAALVFIISMTLWLWNYLVF